MGIADLLKRWLGLSSDKKPQTPVPTPRTPVRPADKARPNLKEMARNSESPSRTPAAPQSSNIGHLIQKHRMSGHAARKGIEQRLGELLVVDASNPDFFRQQDIDRLQAFALFGATPDIREEALRHIRNENVLASIVSEHASSHMRQLAAAQIRDEKLLGFAAESIKHKDKGLYKQIRQRLEGAQAEVRAQEQKRKHLEKLCHDMEAQARMAVSPLFAAKLHSLEQQWKEALAGSGEGPGAELQHRFETATQSARFALAESSRVSEAEAKARQEQHDVVDALQSRLDALTESESWISGEDFTTALTRLEGRWGVALPVIAPESGLRHRYEALHKEARQLARLLEQAEACRQELAGLMTTLSESPGDQAALTRLSDVLKPLALNRQPRLPHLLRQAQTVLSQAQLHSPRKKSARVEKVQKAPKELSAELVALLDRVAALVQDGKVQEAEKALKEARAMARNQKSVSPRLQELADEVYKLKDWARFAILPKKEALVARFETLVATAVTDPDARQEEIKAIQAEWSALGKVNNEAERLLWKRFQELGQQAWEPVKQHLEAQKAQENANAERREALVKELQAYLDQMPESVNWQRHVAILRTAREEWQRHHPVPAKIHKPLLARYTAVTQALEERLQAEYARQEARKKSLIDEAAALVEAADIRAACDSAKQLQQQWKETGSCGHARDQKLWEEFRGHCDAIFARREEAKTAQKTEEQDMIDQAGRLLDQIDEVSHAEDGGEVATALIEAFESLTLSVPREHQTALRARLNEIRRRIEAGRAAATQAGFRADVAGLSALMARFLVLEQAVQSGESAESLAGELDPSTFPAAFAEELNKRLAHLPRTTDVEPGQQLQLFNHHCLLLEILLDLPSPAEEQELRVSRQMTLFKLQRYPKTPEEKQKLVRNTLRAAIVCPSLPAAQSAAALRRFDAIVGSEAFLTLF